MTDTIIETIIQRMSEEYEMEESEVVIMCILMTAATCEVVNEKVSDIIFDEETFNACAKIRMLMENGYNIWSTE